MRATREEQREGECDKESVAVVKRANQIWPPGQPVVRTARRAHPSSGWRIRSPSTERSTAWLIGGAIPEAASKLILNQQVGLRQ
jgi:hypothetical protein